MATSQESGRDRPRTNLILKIGRKDGAPGSTFGLKFVSERRAPERALREKKPEIRSGATIGLAYPSVAEWCSRSDQSEATKKKIGERE